MSIRFRCKCGKKLSAPDGSEGKKAKCPGCHTVSRIPEPGAADIEEAIVIEEEQPEQPEAESKFKASLDDLKKSASGFGQLTSHIEKRGVGTTGLTTSGKALVVDDEADTLATVSELLEHHGYEVIQADRGEKAIELAYKHQPDIVVLDVMLPGINGFEVCKRLKDRAQPGNEGYDVHTPVLMLTAKTKGRDVQYAKSVGADGYLKKPFEPLKLFKKLDKLLTNK